MEHVAASQHDPEFCEAVDKDLLLPVLTLLEKKGIEEDGDELRALVVDLIPAIMRIKYRFNFPRPWQISRAVGLPLMRFASPSAETPSYPSGHALQAGAVCSLLAVRHPEISRELDRIATTIGLTRLQLGVHFPMDIVAGLRVGRHVGRRIAK
jgi:membrane-associated phospholipid phosphatase